MKVTYPKVKVDSKGRVYVMFYQNNKRHRLFNGSKINSTLYPNLYSTSKRNELGHLLAAEVYQFLISGLTFKQLSASKLLKPNMTDRDYLSIALENKLKENYTKKYKYTLTFIYNKLVNELNDDTIAPTHIESVLSHYSTETTYNTYRLRLCSLINEAQKMGMTSDPMQGIKSKKTKEKMHKPFGNFLEVLDDIRRFDSNLYLCSLMTYGCLLRPHREIRELTWGDFSEDLSHVNLSGNRNKSGRNRLVPVPSFIKDILVKGGSKDNIFTGEEKPFNKDYFKTLWSRYKAQSNVLEELQTLYSFRHSGAIEIYKRTGSLTTLQSAMGHASLAVTLGYLRGLEIPSLRLEDMPRL